MMRRILVALLAMASLVAVMPSGAVAATPRVSATPTRQLDDGDVITVTWHGFKPSLAKDGLLIIECLPITSGFEPVACDKVRTHEPTRVPSPLPRSGSASYTVHSGAMNVNGSCGVSTDTNACVVWVVALDGKGRAVPGYSFAIPITFALSKTTPHVTATPTKQLTDGEGVELVGTNFSKTQLDQIWECDGNFATIDYQACHVLTGIYAEGNFDVTVPIRQGMLQSPDGGKCGTTKKNDDCFISIAPYVFDEGQTGPDIHIPISFDLSAG